MISNGEVVELLVFGLVLLQRRQNWFSRLIGLRVLPFPTKLAQFHVQELPLRISDIARALLLDILVGVPQSVVTLVFALQYLIDDVGLGCQQLPTGLFVAPNHVFASILSLYAVLASLETETRIVRV